MWSSYMSSWDLQKNMMSSQYSNKETLNRGVSWLLVSFQIQTTKRRKETKKRFKFESTQI